MFMAVLAVLVFFSWQAFLVWVDKRWPKDHHGTTLMWASVLLVAVFVTLLILYGSRDHSTFTRMWCITDIVTLEVNGKIYTSYDEVHLCDVNAPDAERKGYYLR